MMVNRIRSVVERVGEFLRRKLEVWFVLVILAMMGVSGRLILDRIETTQDALCRNSYSSAATKDLFIDEFAEAFGVDETNPSILRLRGFVEQERNQVEDSCPTPSARDLNPPFKP